jgi:hypothetical protein
LEFRFSKECKRLALTFLLKVSQSRNGGRL